MIDTVMKRRRGDEVRGERLCSATGSTVMKMQVLPMEQCDRNPRLGLCWGGNVREVMSMKPTGPCTGMPVYMCNMCLHTYMCFCVTGGLCGNEVKDLRDVQPGFTSYF